LHGQNNARQTVGLPFAFLEKGDYEGLAKSSIVTPALSNVMRAREKALGRVQRFSIDAIDVELLGYPWGAFVTTMRNHRTYKETFGGNGRKISTIHEATPVLQ